MDRICSEYSAELQQSILGITVAELLEPILDLGCGPGGRLVCLLRRQGKEAAGIDRAPAASEGVSPGDWLTCPLPVGELGTVISHMGLSNELLHQHLRRDGHPARLVRRYLEILRALRPGGCFLYAPGLPFLEEHLPRRRYRVERRPVAELAGGPLDAALERRYGAAVLYACRVTSRPLPSPG